MILLQAPSTRILIFLNPQLFLSGYENIRVHTLCEHSVFKSNSPVHKYSLIVIVIINISIVIIVVIDIGFIVIVYRYRHHYGHCACLLLEKWFERLVEIRLQRQSFRSVLEYMTLFNFLPHQRKQDSLNQSLTNLSVDMLRKLL